MLVAGWRGQKIPISDRTRWGGAYGRKWQAVRLHGAPLWGAIGLRRGLIRRYHNLQHHWVVGVGGVGRVIARDVIAWSQVY